MLFITPEPSYAFYYTILYVYCHRLVYKNSLVGCPVLITIVMKFRKRKVELETYAR